MPKQAAVETLRTGTGILTDLLARHGFSAGPIESGHGSGGEFAAIEFTRGGRRLELHFRHSLGLVQYHLGSVGLSHEDYMWSVLGRRWQSHYPGFSDDPLDAFRRLRLDLEEHGQDFLAGPDADFLKHADRASALQANAAQLP